MILLFYIDKRLEKVLKEYIDVEVFNITNRVVNNIILRNNFTGKYLIIDENTNNISYDTKVINEYVDLITKKIEKKVYNFDMNGDFFNSKMKYKDIHDGVIYNVMFSSIRKSTLFSSLGPSIPIKLKFIGNVKSKIKTEIREYGINNMLVNLILIVNVKMRISFPFTSNEQVITIEQPLSIDIIRGDVPNYYKNS